MTLQERIEELVDEHGSYRAAARVLGVCSHVYLFRLCRGDATEPGDEVLEALGLRRVVTYERMKKPPGGPGGIAG